MKTTLATAILVASTVLAAVATPQNAAAGQFSTLFGKPVSAQLLAYAPEPQYENRFEQFDEGEEMHELNDAWLGMPAHDANGKLIGFIEDAYLDDAGDVSELLVSLSDHSYAVYVDGTLATLGESEVGIALSGQAIANLERAEDFVLVQR